MIALNFLHDNFAVSCGVIVILLMNYFYAPLLERQMIDKCSCEATRYEYKRVLVENTRAKSCSSSHFVIAQNEFSMSSAQLNEQNSTREQNCRE